MGCGANLCHLYKSSYTPETHFWLWFMVPVQTLATTVGLVSPAFNISLTQELHPLPLLRPDLN